MSDLMVPSRSALSERRRRLRRQRRWKALQLMWRTLLAGGFAGGLIWVIAQPGWVLRGPEQISVDGTEFLSEETVRSLIPLNYPTSILTVESEAIAETLRARGPIAHVVVHRSLFPPGLSVYVTERHPVAVLIGNTYDNSSGAAATDDPSASLAVPSQLTPTGLIDANGAWMPLESYTNVNQDLDLPQLRLIGMRSSFRQSWMTLFSTLQRSPVEVYEIDWRNSANLIINSELGVIHLGAYEEALFAKQLEMLDKMRGLANQVDLAQVDYIDLRSPEEPLVQFNRGAPNYDQTTLPPGEPLLQDDDSEADEPGADEPGADDLETDDLETGDLGAGDLEADNLEADDSEPGDSEP